MKQMDPTDMLIIRMGIDSLLVHVRQTAAWWRVGGDHATSHRMRQLEGAITQTHRKLFADERPLDIESTEAMLVADGLRDAAKHCTEGQAALHARLIGGAETIERLCRIRRE